MVGRADGGLNLNNNLGVKAFIGDDAASTSRKAHIFKEMIEKSKPSTPLGGSY